MRRENRPAGARELAILAALRAGPLDRDGLARSCRRPVGSIDSTLAGLVRRRVVFLRMDFETDPPRRVYRLSATGRQITIPPA
ncbi:MAG: hypothetical protein O6913_10830 [Chloroflexi bacterium]|nr:hypothetical protein [Chloroflexota bacterium]